MHKRSSLAPILSQLNPVCSFTPYYSTIYFHIILPLRRSLSLRFHDQYSEQFLISLMIT
jgi:hypothetical protein